HLRRARSPRPLDRRVPARVAPRGRARAPLASAGHRVRRRVRGLPLRRRRGGAAGSARASEAPAAAPGDRPRAPPRRPPPAVALTTSAVEHALRAAGAAELGSLQLVATDALPDRANDWRQPALAADALAFLQYTSGSTASPKGVMVSHANLAHNERALERCW